MNAKLLDPITTEEFEKLTYRQRVGLRLECGNARCRRVFTIGERENGREDKRTRFCCEACERQHWRDVTRHPAKAGCGTPMTEFHSIADYISYERRTNGA